MPQQRVIIDAQSLLALFTAYYDGRVPLDAKVLQIGVSEKLQRYIGILVESDQWEDSDTGPLHLRYEGRRNMAWAQSQGDEPIKWGREGSDFEVPKG